MTALFAPLLLSGQFVIARLLDGQWDRIREVDFVFAAVFSLIAFFLSPGLRRLSPAMAKQIFLIIAACATLGGLAFLWQIGLADEPWAHRRLGGFVIGSPFVMWGVAFAALARAIVSSRRPESRP